VAPFGNKRQFGRAESTRENDKGGGKGSLKLKAALRERLAACSSEKRKGTIGGSEEGDMQVEKKRSPILSILNATKQSRLTCVLLPRYRNSGKVVDSTNLWYQLQRTQNLGPSTWWVVALETWGDREIKINLVQKCRPPVRGYSWPPYDR